MTEDELILLRLIKTMQDRLNKRDMIERLQISHMTLSVSEVSDRSRGWPEGSFFNNYYIEV